jgi:hypothetical protein
MQKTQKLLLAAIIQAAILPTAFASEQSESKGLLEDAEGTVLFRTGFLDRDKKQGLDDTRSSAQTAMVKLETGFSEGVVGFGAGVIGDWSFKLGANDHAGNQMIPRDKNGNTLNQWTRGGGFVKARISNTTATYGTQVLDIPVFASNTVRLVPEYFTGVLIESNEIDNLNLIAGKFTKNQMSHQISTDGNDLIRAYVWGAKYKFNDQLNASYYGLDSKKKLERHFINTNYTYNLKDDASLNIDFSGYHTKFDKDAETESQIINNSETRKNSIWALSSTYSKDAQSVMLAYQQNSGNTGYDYGYNADGFQSIYLPNSYLSDFNGNHEKSLGLQYHYNFKNHGLPGLSWTNAFVYGWDIKVSDPNNRANLLDTAEEHEFFSQLKYTVQSGPMKDSSLRLRHSYLRTSNTYATTGNNAIGSTNEWRIWLDIPVKLF